MRRGALCAECAARQASICHCRMCQKAFGSRFLRAAGRSAAFGASSSTRGTLATFESSDVVDARLLQAIAGRRSRFDTFLAKTSMSRSVRSTIPRSPGRRTRTASSSRLPWFDELHDAARRRHRGRRDAGALCADQAHQSPAPRSRYGPMASGGSSPMKERLYLFDTTLRDGQQTPGIDFSLEDKILVAKHARRARRRLCRGRLSRRQPDRHRVLRKEADEPRRVHRLRHGEARRPLGRPTTPACRSSSSAEADAICFVGKAWDFHVRLALGCTQRGEPRVRSRSRSRRRSRPGARRCSTASTSSTATRPIPTTRSPASRRRLTPARAGSVLCDTNGGTLPDEVEAIVGAVVGALPAASGSASMRTTIPARRWRIRSPRCAPARARSRAR